MSATPVGKALEKTIWEVHQCQEILEANAANIDVERILKKLDDYMASLPNLRQAAQEQKRQDDADGSNTLLPVTAVTLVDEGKCPTRGMVDSLLEVGAANLATKGKTNVFEKLHAELEAQNAEQPRVEAGKEPVNEPVTEMPSKRKRGK